MKKLVIATTNTGKIKEIEHFFKGYAITLRSLTEFDFTAVEETGSTFIENALLKARHACAISGLPALADDSGIVIDALNGEPGIFSARYAGEPGNTALNNQKVLDAMRDVPFSHRTAYFYCACVLLRSAQDPAPIIGLGKWNGMILSEPRGVHGFGYDPCFYIPELNCSAAELDLAAKNRLSHRGQALNNLTKQLDDFI